jgi:hypothetical protein
MSEAAVVESTAVGQAVTVAVIDSLLCRPAGRPSLLVMFTGMKAVPAFAVPTTVNDVYPTLKLLSAADAGVTEVKTPKPIAATATSAMRLKVVFVDICFLSISRTEEFPQFGLNQISLIRFDESHVLIHQIPHRVSGRGRETYLFVCHLHRLR